MHDASNFPVGERMSVVKCRCDPIPDPQDLLGRQLAHFSKHPQVHAVHEREDDVGPSGLELVIEDAHQVRMLKSSGDARFTREVLPALAVFGPVRMQPFQAPPAFGAVLAYPEDFERFPGAADSNATHHSVVVDRCGALGCARHVALASFVLLRPNPHRGAFP
jgi:hypothetical protein